MSKVYSYVTEKILEIMGKGIVPWHRPWRGGESNTPRNMVSGHKYRGGNLFLLSCQAYASPYWLTAKQIGKLGGRFEGKPTMILYWNWIKKSDPVSGKDKKVPFLRYYNVWNFEQTTGIPAPKSEIQAVPQVTFTPIEVAERILSESSVQPIVRTGGQASYQPATDTVTMPAKEHFIGSEEYYCTRFHETAHATGHKTRLDRDLTGSFGTGSYSKEELIAEMTAAFLCGTTGIESKTLDNSAAYIQTWMRKLRADEKLFVSAAAAAQKAADLILNVKFEDKDDEE